MFYDENNFSGIKNNSILTNKTSTINKSTQFQIQNQVPQNFYQSENNYNNLINSAVR